MSDKEALLKLNELIAFFRNYGSMLSEMDKSIEEEQRAPLAA